MKLPFKNIYFGFDNSKLSTSDKTELDRVSGVLNKKVINNAKTAEQRIQVRLDAGFNDGDGKFHREGFYPYSN